MILQIPICRTYARSQNRHLLFVFTLVQTPFYSFKAKIKGQAKLVLLFLRKRMKRFERKRRRRGLGGRPLAVREEGSPARRSGRNSASARASEAFRAPQAGKKKGAAFRRKMNKESKQRLLLIRMFWISYEISRLKSAKLKNPSRTKVCDGFFYMLQTDWESIKAKVLFWVERRSKNKHMLKRNGKVCNYNVCRSFLRAIW